VPATSGLVTISRFHFRSVGSAYSAKVPRDRVTRSASVLGGVLGSIYLVLGVLEGITHLDEPASLAVWLPALLGGGTLVLVGVFKVKEPGWLSNLLVASGLVAASAATVWTVLLPLANVALLVLVVVRSGRLAVAVG
jgi:hypothetical protein